MRKFGLIGQPLTHSFSKKYFAEKFEREQIAGCHYELYPIESIEQLPALFDDELLEGLNVTIPYKKQVLAYLDELTPPVAAMQACNCIVNCCGKKIGFNTDIVGFEQTFAPHLQPHHTRALVLGSGGASSAVAYVLGKLNIEYLFVSRKTSSATNVISYGQVDERLIKSYSIIINTTPLGTSPNYHECPPLPYQFITAAHYLYDLVYNPPKTIFLSKGEERGAIIENGSQMLIIQAEESWKIWNQYYTEDVNR